MQKMLEPQELKEMLGIALGSVYKLIKQPGFPAIKVSARRYVIPEDAFNRWIDEQIANSMKEMKQDGKPDGASGTES